MASQKQKYTGTWRVKFGIRKLVVLQSDWTAKILQLPRAFALGYVRIYIPGGWLGWNCVLVVRDGGVLHSSPLSINSLSGQLLSVLQLNWVAWDV